MGERFSANKVNVPATVVADFERDLNRQIADELSPAIDSLSYCRESAKAAAENNWTPGSQEGNRVTAMWGGVPNNFWIDALGQVHRRPIGCPEQEVVFEGEASVDTKPEFGKALLLATSGKDVFMLVENDSNDLNGAHEIRRIASPWHRGLTKPLYGICFHDFAEIDYHPALDVMGPLDPEDLFVQNGVVMGVYWSYSLRQYIDLPLQTREPHVSTAY